jgi:putative cell wall-binding protein
MRYRSFSATLLVAVVAMQFGASASAASPDFEADVVVVGGETAVPAAIVSHLDACVPGVVARVEGADRYATAAAISQRWEASDVVYLATGANFPDAIAAGPVAAIEGAPILLTRRDVLPAVTLDALSRLSPRRVVLLGGDSVISTTVERQLRSTVPEVVRIAGRDRYETASIVSRSHFADGASVVYVATGLDFLDALLAGPRAAAEGAPLLLVPGESVPESTAAEIRRLAPERIVLVGSTAVVSEGVESLLAELGSATVVRVAGSSRYTTAQILANDSTAGRVFVVTTDDFPDGLAAIPATDGAPSVFASAESLHAVTALTINQKLGTACDPWSLPYPDVGEGKRIIYSNSQQRIWLIDENGGLVDTYLVSGRKGIPYVGTYEVYSKSVNAWAPYDGITMKHMVRFVRPGTWGNTWAYGFHSIPRYADGRPMQTEAQLGTHRSGGCVRQADHKAAALFEWAAFGTPVHAIP